jgi:hypothetical protein
MTTEVKKAMLDDLSGQPRFEALVQKIVGGKQ